MISGRDRGGALADVVQVLPAMTVTADMVPSTVGSFYFHCHVGMHAMHGMAAMFHVHPCDQPGPGVSPCSLARATPAATPVPLMAWTGAHEDIPQQGESGPGPSPSSSPATPSASPGEQQSGNTEPGAVSQAGAGDDSNLPMVLAGAALVVALASLAGMAYILVYRRASPVPQGTSAAAASSTKHGARSGALPDQMRVTDGVTMSKGPGAAVQRGGNAKSGMRGPAGSVLRSKGLGALARPAVPVDGEADRLVSAQGGNRVDQRGVV